MPSPNTRAGKKAMTTDFQSISKGKCMKKLPLVFIALFSPALCFGEGLYQDENGSWVNSRGGNIYGDSNINPNADPRVNPNADPRVNPNADPTVNPNADPTVNPYADPRLNPYRN